MLKKKKRERVIFFLKLTLVETLRGTFPLSRQMRVMMILHLAFLSRKREGASGE